MQKNALIPVQFFCRSGSASEFIISGTSSNFVTKSPPVVTVIGLYRENAIAIESEANDSFGGNVYHGGIRYGALSSQRSHSNAYAVWSPLAAKLLMAQTQSIIVTCTGFHAFGTRSRVWRR